MWHAHQKPFIQDFLEKIMLHDYEKTPLGRWRKIDKVLMIDHLERQETFGFGRFCQSGSRNVQFWPEIKAVKRAKDSDRSEAVYKGFCDGSRQGSSDFESDQLRQIFTKFFLTSLRISSGVFLTHGTRTFQEKLKIECFWWAFHI